MQTQAVPTDESLKQAVRDAYAAIAQQPYDQNAASACGCGPTCCSLPDDPTRLMADDYAQLDGYVAEADLGLGCGLPTAFARIKPGDTVIDLGSGAGNDCFVARHETGPTGKVIGIDFTEPMIDRARRNADLRGFNNVEFRFGDIEQMPVRDNTANVVVSNCVLNLVPNKPNVIAEIFRVLKPGGHFSISDIVLLRDLPANLRRPAELYSGCISGAIQKEDYLRIIDETGFVNVVLQKEKPIILPDDFLAAYLTTDEVTAYRAVSTGIVSVTVYAEKPAADVTTHLKPASLVTAVSNSLKPVCPPPNPSSADMAILIENARPADKAAVAALLQQRQLPTEDLSADLSGFMVAKEHGLPVGVAGLERVGTFALLRSVAVDSRYQGRQIAAHLIGHLLETARAAGLEGIYLITTSAGPYFERYGFRSVDRTKVPTAIQQTQQFSNLCPSSAVVMKYDLPADNEKRPNP